MMRIDVEKYKIVSKIFLGTNLKILFRNEVDPNDKKILELKEVIGFIDTTSANKVIQTLRLDNEGVLIITTYHYGCNVKKL